MFQLVFFSPFSPYIFRSTDIFLTYLWLWAESFFWHSRDVLVQSFHLLFQKQFIYIFESCVYGFDSFWLKKGLPCDAPGDFRYLCLL